MNETLPTFILRFIVTTIVKSFAAEQPERFTLVSDEVPNTTIDECRQGVIIFGGDSIRDAYEISRALDAAKVENILFYDEGMSEFCVWARDSDEACRAVGWPPEAVGGPEDWVEENRARLELVK